jgi:hypothetical protein
MSIEVVCHGGKEVPQVGNIDAIKNCRGSFSKGNDLCASEDGIIKTKAGIAPRLSHAWSFA